MAARLVERALRIRGLTKVEKLVLAVYASRANDRTNEASAGSALVAEILGDVDVRSVDRARRVLEDRGLLRVKEKGARGRGRATVYVVMETRLHAGFSEESTENENSEKQLSTNPAPRRVSDSGKPGTENMAPRHPHLTDVRGQGEPLLADGSPAPTENEEFSAEIDALLADPATRKRFDTLASSQMKAVSVPADREAVVREKLVRQIALNHLRKAS